MERQGLARLGFVLSCGLAVAAAEPWRAIGPGGGGAQFRPTVSPHDPRLVVVGTDMNAGFVSEDQGGTWRRFHLRSRLKTVLFDPVDPAAIHVLLPGTLGLYRSPDRGRSWLLAYPPPETVERLIHQDDEAEAALVTRPPLAPLEAVDADPTRPGVFYGVRAGRLEVSLDGGAHWRALAAGLPEEPIEGNGRALFVDPASPAGRRAGALVGSSTVVFWREGGEAWRRSAPPGTARIAEAAWGTNPAGLYLLTAEPPGLWVTRDAGERWTRLALPAGARYRGLAVAARQGRHLYLSYHGLAGWLTTLFGVLRSEDGGGTWRRVWSDAEAWPDGWVRDAWLTPAFGPDWGENPLEIGVAPDHPEIAFATDYGRTMRTTDSGRRWQGVYSRRLRPSPDRWTSTGLDVTTTYGVHFDPFDARRLFIAYTDIGLFRSEDGGASWEASSLGMPRAWRNTTYAVAFDPRQRGRMWAAASSVHDLPRMKMVRRWQPEAGRWHGGVCVSRDGGRTWTPSNRGLPDLPVTDLLIEPDASRLYAAVFGGGLYVSEDGGATWQPRARGIASGARPLVWRLARDQAGTLYAVVARRSESLAFGNPETDGAIYRSVDEGARWERLALPAGVNGPHAIAADPRDPLRLYVASFGRFEPGALTPAEQGGVHLSTDGGRTWRPTLSADQYVWDVAVDPAAPDVVYAAGYQSSLWRSDDAGEHWRRVPGFNVKNAHRVTPDPQRPGWVYVSSYGSSVWHGLGTGDPAAAEDIVTPAVGYRR